MKPEGVMESCIYVEDLDAAEAFYSKIIGLEMIAKEAGRHVFFRCGQGVVLVFNPAVTSTQLTKVGGSMVPLHGTRGAGHLAFRVSDGELGEWRQRMREADIAIESEVRWPQGGASIYFRDPGGNSIEFVTPATWRMA